MKVAIIGAGNMGSAIAHGLVTSGMVSACNIRVSNPSTGKLIKLSNNIPTIYTTTDNCVAVQGVDMVFLTVKPWKMEEVIKEIKPSLDYTKQVVISVAGGVGSNQLDEWLLFDVSSLPQLYIAIPNTAIATGFGVTFISGKRTTDIVKKSLQDMFSTMGKVFFVDEALIPAGTSLASCGIAYALKYIQAATEGGLRLGFTPEESLTIVLQTVQGALEVLRGSSASPADEIARVTTPGGLTLKGLQAMDNAGFGTAVMNGLQASTITK